MAQADRTNPKRRRRLLVLGIVLLTALCLVLIAWRLLTQGSIPRALAQRELGKIIDAEVSVDAARVGLDGRVVLRGVKIRARDIDGTPGEVLSADTIDASLAGLLSGKPELRSIVILKPRLRVSQNIDTGLLNLAGVSIASGGSGTAPTSLPSIEVRDGIIEIGEHTHGTYALLRTVPISGTLAPSRSADEYGFQISHGLAEGSNSTLTGSIAADAIDVLVDELDLASWPNEAVPTRYRELHRRLALSGKVEPTQIHIDRETGLNILVRFQGIELSIPLEELPVERARMTHVGGEIRLDASGFRASVAGLLNGVPTTALFEGSGTSMDADFECAISVGRVQLTENLGRLSYLPEFVREQLAIFSNPVAQVELDLVLARSSQTGKDIQATGEIRLFQGVASYVRFPYEFVDMEAVFLLDADRLTIDRVSGRAPSGAKLEASGWVSPLGPDAEAVINVRATDVPLDDTLRTGLGERYGRVYDVLLDQESLARLTERGLICSPQQARDWTEERSALRGALRRSELTGAEASTARARLTELDALLDRPAFALGGSGTVEVNIHRMLGIESNWTTSVRVMIPSAGLLPEAFPLPIIAQDIVLSIVNDEARLADGSFRGIDGGIASVSAETDIESAESHIQITARNIPVTPRLIGALPVEPEGQDKPVSLRRLLEQLEVRGELDCVATLSGDLDEGETPPFEARADLRDISIRPLADGSTLELQAINGQLVASNDGVDAALTGRVALSAGAEPPTPLGADVSIRRTPESGDVEIRSLALSLPAFQLATPVEQLIGLIDADAAEQLAEYRTRSSPDGIVDVLVEQGQSGARVTLDNPRSVALTVDGARVALSPASGQLVLERNDRPRVIFRDFGGTATLDGQAAGFITLAGDMMLSPASGTLDVHLTDCPVESLRIERIATTLPDALRRFLADSSAEGLFDASLGLAFDDAGTLAVRHALIQPRSLSLLADGERVVLDPIEGLVRFDGSVGKVEDLRFQSPQWRGLVAGSFETTPEGLGMMLDVSGEATGLPTTLLALLPENLGSLVSQLDASVLSMRLEGGKILAATGQGEPELSVLGELVVRGAAAKAGVSLSDLDGRIAFAAHMYPELETPRFEIQIEADRLRASGVWLKSASATIRSTDDGTAVEVGPFSATAHDGRVAGSAVVWTDPATDKARFDLNLLASGVRLAPTLRDLAPESAQPGAGDTADDTRGLVDGQITVYGEVDGPRRGAGNLLISQGRVLRLPLVVPLIKVSNLQLPSAEQLEVARSQFFLLNNTLMIEEISVYSRSVELLGYGTLDLDTQALDLRINTRSRQALPILTQLIDNLRDELVTVRVDGSVAQPRIRTEQFATTRRALGALVGRDLSEQERVMQEIRQEAARYRERTRLGREQISRVVRSYAPTQDDQKP